MTAVPTYVSIKNRMVQMIRDGRYNIGEQLPSEYDMAEKFKVSRVTWRRAATALEKEGFITIKRGIGAFITQQYPQIANNLRYIRSLTDMILEAGIYEEPSQSSITTIPASPELASKLLVAVGSPLTKLDRVRIADGEPISHSLNYLEMKPELTFEELDLNRSILRRIEQSMHIQICRSFTEICIPDADDPFLAVFNPEKQRKILLLRSLHYDTENKPIFYSLDYLRNDVFEFTIMRTLPDR